MSLDVVIDTLQTQAVSEQALTWLDKARAVAVTDAATYEKAADLVIGIKALRAQVNEAFDPIIADAHRVHKTACDKKRQADAPLVDAEWILKRAMADYDTAQEHWREAEERRLQAIARQSEETRRVEEAAALEREAQATGDVTLQAEALALLDQPVFVPAVSVARTTPKVNGIAHRENWSARITSLLALVTFVAAHPEHVNLLVPNQPALNALARSMRTHLKIDGVQAVNTPSVAVGARASGRNW